MSFKCFTHKKDITFHNHFSLSVTNQMIWVSERNAGEYHFQTFSVQWIDYIISIFTDGKKLWKSLLLSKLGENNDNEYIITYYCIKRKYITNEIGEEILSK